MAELENNSTLQIKKIKSLKKEMRNQMEKIIAECSRCNVEIQFFTDEEFIELIEQHYPICF